jgi:phosphoenolpyruvate synthase/pyruvate phosphate dikinase
VDLLWLGEPVCSDVSVAGGKIASLSRLASSYPVPPGFCLPASAVALFGGANGDVRAPISDAFLAAIEGAYQSLGARCGVDDVPVAVRSSAVDEDGAEASFAGQHATFLNVVGAPAIAAAIIQCWASVHSERALAYRRGRGAAYPSSGIAVLVQRLVPANVSAVAFSANPVTGNRDDIVINANWGLGESIVGGMTTPDTHHVRKADLAVLSSVVGEKRLMTVPVEGGTREVDVPRFLRSRPALDGRQVVEVAQLVRELEQRFGFPADVECAHHGGQIYLLQCRPITTIARGHRKP